MAIKRISDLSSILNVGKNSDGTLHLIDKNTAVQNYVTIKTTANSDKYSTSKILTESLFEISWPKVVNKETEDFTNFESRSISYDVLSTFMLLHITNETYTFYGSKTFKNGNILIDHTEKNVIEKIYTVDIKSSELRLDNTDLSIYNGGILSADVKDAEICVNNTDGKCYIHNNDNSILLDNNKILLSAKNDINLIINDNVQITLNGKNGLTLKAAKINFEYEDQIKFIRTKDNSYEEVFVLSNETENGSIKDRVHFKKSDEDNPIYGCIRNALWA